MSFTAVLQILSSHFCSSHFRRTLFSCSFRRLLTTSAFPDVRNDRLDSCTYLMALMPWDVVLMLM
jgi:hypothetical protein